MTRKEAKHELLLTFLLALEHRVDAPTPHPAGNSVIASRENEDLNNAMQTLYLQTRNLFEIGNKSKLSHLRNRISSRLRSRKSRKELIPLYG